MHESPDFEFAFNLSNDPTIIDTVVKEQEQQLEEEIEKLQTQADKLSHEIKELDPAGVEVFHEMYHYLYCPMKIIMKDEPKSDLVSISQNLRSLSVGAKKIFSEIVDDALMSAKSEVLNNEREYKSGKYWRMVNGKPHGRGKYIGPETKKIKDPQSNLIAIGKWRGYVTDDEFNEVYSYE